MKAQNERCVLESFHSGCFCLQGQPATCSSFQRETLCSSAPRHPDLTYSGQSSPVSRLCSSQTRLRVAQVHGLSRNRAARQRFLLLRELSIQLSVSFSCSALLLVRTRWGPKPFKKEAFLLLREYYLIAGSSNLVAGYWHRALQALLRKLQSEPASSAAWCWNCRDTVSSALAAGNIHMDSSFREMVLFIHAGQLNRNGVLPA
jgi:hypothetical protein